MYDSCAPSCRRPSRSKGTGTAATRPPSSRARSLCVASESIASADVWDGDKVVEYDRERARKTRAHVEGRAAYGYGLLARREHALRRLGLDDRLDQAPSLRYLAADDHYVGVEPVDETRYADAEVARRLRDRLGRRRVARLDQLYELAHGWRALARRAAELLVTRHGRLLRRVQVPAPALPAATLRPVRVNRDVAELARGVFGTAVERAVYDDAAREARADADVEEVSHLRVLRLAVPDFGERGAARRVVYRDGKARRL